MELMCVIGAAMHLGYKSRLQLYKLINDGWLNEHVHVLSGQQLLDVEGGLMRLTNFHQRNFRNDIGYVLMNIAKSCNVSIFHLLLYSSFAISSRNHSSCLLASSSEY